MVGYVKGRIRREDILSAAVAVYGEVGYHGASLREIAKRVGITHAGLLYYFPSKEALLAAVLERRDAADAERERLLGNPGLEVLRSFVALTAHNAQDRGIVDIYSRLAAEAVSPGHPAHDYFKRHYRDARACLVESFQVLARCGQLRDGVDAGQAAVMFIALMDGLQVQWLTNPAEVDMVASVRGFLEYVLAVPLDAEPVTGPAQSTVRS
ncbi:TetR/AcrR family transcriptional regulator [Stackebrandtia nassauensis]|uniref:Transcriptional regulator, TetR family n=1 Tax=Stackebrandtia nassauensis (strain DSM 44728 / CIP 108903 / NRRL B-16338 / NBRC 102104 / LLR-40K-21) TaxID=446470 RepID=D3PVP9_STANL|nr:TetR/AcrR family transcriptional regulator [Stackebrandtia nassauensis]ADD43163.1 transcriptional regulator, TetR family [Stackebrandtia nassauensis DSM 44728]